MKYEARILKALENGPLTQPGIAQKVKFKASTQVYAIVKRMIGKGLVGKAGNLIMKVDNSSPFPVEQINRAVEAAAHKPTSVFDPRFEVLWGEVDAIDQRLDYLMIIKMHLVNRINEYKDAAARSSKK